MEGAEFVEKNEKQAERFGCLETDRKEKCEYSVHYRNALYCLRHKSGMARIMRMSKCPAC